MSENTVSYNHSWKEKRHMLLKKREIYQRENNVQPISIEKVFKKYKLKGTGNIPLVDVNSKYQQCHQGFPILGLLST